MNQSFLFKVKSLNRTEVADVTSYDAVNLLNEAQKSIVDELIAAGRYDLLHTITDSTSIAAGSFASYDNTPSGGIVVDLSGISDYRNYVRSESNMTRSAVPAVAVAKNFANTEIAKEEIKIYETNGINKPLFTSPRSYVEGTYLIVVPDAYSTVVAEKITYVRVLDTLVLTGAGAGETVTCELPAFLHEKVVDIAVVKSRETVNINDIKQ